MKIVVVIARVLIGLMFIVFGLNAFLNFIPVPSMTGLMNDYMTVFAASHELQFVGAVQLIAGLLMLSGMFVPLALIVYAAIIYNILVFHITMQPQGIPPALILLVLWAIVGYAYRERFAGVFSR